MKPLFLVMFFASALTILSSCEKESSNLITYPGNDPLSQPLTLDLVASNWINEGGEVYVDNFAGVLSNANLNRNGTISVYLESNGKEAKINYGAIEFMTGQLWATISGTDVRINYRPYYAHPLPFRSLDIKLVVE
jgi:hypothetical protein